MMTSSHSTNCIFTICTKSYIGLAEALGTSMRDNNVDADFLIIVVDHDVSDVVGVTGNVVSAKHFCKYSDEEWTSRTFKYDLVELCTSIKARAFQSSFELGFEKAIYFDPDIIVFDDLSGVFGALDTHDVVATPHRLSIESEFPARGGVFNLGFLAAKNNAAAKKAIRWWDERLEHYSINDPMRGYFTDQKWMDHLPVFLRNDKLLISDHPGMNLAPWNITEREMSKKDGMWTVRLKEDGTSWQPLCFAHFSAFNYRGLAEGTVIEAEDPSEKVMPGFGALLEVLATYLKRGDFLKYASIPYEYGAFSGGRPVLPGHRRIYHRLVDLDHMPAEPFQDSGAFFAQLKRSRLLTSVGSAPAKRSDARAFAAQTGRAAKFADVLARFFVLILGYPRYALLNKFLMRYFHPVNHVRLLREFGKDVDVKYF